MLAFVFPGQGSQYVGMGKQFYDSYDYVREIFASADNELGFSLTELIFNGPAEELQKTVNAQPAILTVSVAMYEVLKRAGLMPGVVAGHSLGEYSALVAAGALGFNDAVRLVRTRGQLMQEAVPLGQGGMMAVLGMKSEDVAKACGQAANLGIIEPANYNCPGQVVVAGEMAALQQSQEIFKEFGARRCVPLQVSAPFHSSMMTPAAEKLALELDQAQIGDPQMPVVANVSAGYVARAADIREALKRQVAGAVLWEQSISRLVDDGYDAFVEVGPGQVLTGLIKKISKGVRCVHSDEQDLDMLFERVKEAV